MAVFVAISIVFVHWFIFHFLLFLRMVMYVKEFVKNKNKQNKIQIQGKTEPKR